MSRGGYERRPVSARSNVAVERRGVVGGVYQVEKALKMLDWPRWVNMGFRTGRQAFMTPRRASRQVRRAMSAYCDWGFLGLILVVIFIRTRVVAQILGGVLERVYCLKHVPLGFLVAERTSCDKKALRKSLRYAHGKYPTQNYLLARRHL